MIHYSDVCFTFFQVMLVEQRECWGPQTTCR